MSLTIGEEQIPTGEGDLITHLVALQVGIMMKKIRPGAGSTQSTMAAPTRSSSSVAISRTRTGLASSKSREPTRRRCGGPTVATMMTGTPTCTGWP